MHFSSTCLQISCTFSRTLHVAALQNQNPFLQLRLLYNNLLPPLTIAEILDVGARQEFFFKSCDDGENHLSP